MTVVHASKCLRRKRSGCIIHPHHSSRSQLIFLDLAHGRATANATGAHAGATAATEAGQDGGDEEGGEAEPQEGGRGLRLTAALAGALGDVVVGDEVL